MVDGASSNSSGLQAEQRPGRGSEPSVVVYHGDRTPEGDPIEPEEQVAEVVQPIQPLITLGGGPMREDVPLDSLPPEIQRLAATRTAHIAHQTSAGELAASVLTRCGNCCHFDGQGWSGFIRRAEASGDKRLWQALNEVRGELMSALGTNLKLSEQHDLDHSGDPDLEHALKSLGLCRALTEHFKEDIIVLPINPCSQIEFFKPRKELEAKRAASSGYDWVMRRAQRGPRE